MVIGLCGRMGSGKSIALSILSRLGVDVIDCDDVSRTVCEKGSPCLDELVDFFGNGILLEDGSLDRNTLAKIGFSSENNRNKLNEITHKHILSYVRNWIKQRKNDCVVAAPLLFESGFNKECDVTLGIIAPDEVLLSRMDGRFSKDDFLARIKKQYSDKFLVENCDFVIENSSTLEAFENKIALFLACVKNN